MVSRRPIHEGVWAVVPVVRAPDSQEAGKQSPRPISARVVAVEPEVLGVLGAMATVMAITVVRAAIQPTTYATSLANPPRVATRTMPASTTTAAQPVRAPSTGGCHRRCVHGGPHYGQGGSYRRRRDATGRSL